MNIGISFRAAFSAGARGPLVLVLCQRWAPRFGVGSLIALMLPFSIAFMIAGFLTVAVWAAFAIPVGPGASATYLLQ